MEEIEELRAKAIASMASASIQKNKSSPKSKEEGELSSSEDAEKPPSSAEVNAVATKAPVESSVTPVVKTNSSSGTGKLSSVIVQGRSTDVPFKTSVKHSHSKPVVKNAVPSKHGNRHSSAWYAPSVQSNNLVIRFSDDDSGSDSQELIPDNTSKEKETGYGAERSLQTEPVYKPKNTNNQLKKMPKTVSLSRTRTFVSSLTNIHRPNPRGSRPSLAVQVTHSRNSDPLNSASASHDHEVSSGKNLNNSKLEHLRQQIAIRENQLKLKTVQQNKKVSSGSSHDHDGINPNKNATKRSRPISGNTTRVAPSEPEKKRLKLDSPQRMSNTDAERQIQRPITASESKLRIPPLEDVRQQDRNLMTCSQSPEEVTVGTLSLTFDKQSAKAGNQIHGLSGNSTPRLKDGESSRFFHETTPSEVPNSEMLSKREGYSSNISRNCFQSGKTNRLGDSAALEPSSSLGQMISGRDNSCHYKMSSLKKSNTEGLNLHDTLGAIHLPAREKATKHNIDQGSVPNGVMPGNEIQVSPSSASPRDYLAGMDLLGHNHMNVDILVAMEESHDKELEEAQEHRHRCELNERNALKAYRETQRALVEANARCTYLYRKRELFSAQLRASMMENSTSLWSSTWQKNPRAGMDSLNNIPKVNVDHLPTSGHPTHAETDVLIQDSNIQGTNDGVVNKSCQQMGETDMVPDNCNEPDARMLEMLHHKDNDAVDGNCTPSHGANMSADEDEDEDASLFVHKTTQSMTGPEDVEIFNKRVQDLNNNSERVSSLDNVSDYEILEASLRSELFARLGTKSISKNKNLLDVEAHTADNTLEHLVESNNSDTMKAIVPFVEPCEEQIPNMSGQLNKQPTFLAVGTDGMETSSCPSPIQVQTPAQGLGNVCSDYQSHSRGDTHESISSLEKACISIATEPSLPSQDRKLVFSYVRLTPLISFRRVQIKIQDQIINSISHEDESSLSHSELVLDVLRARARGNMGEVGCYSCDYSVDPFQPVCMFELRGKCNDEECLWQHVKDSGVNLKQHDFSKGSDCLVALSSNFEKNSDSFNLSRHPKQYSIPAPTYLVGLDLLKADLRTSGTILAQTVGRSWQKCFSTSSSVPFTIHKTLFPNVPYSYGSDDCVGGQGSRSRRSTYFQSQDGSLIGLEDPEQCLEKALVLYGDANKLDGIAKAQTTLSRALEANPTLVSLWIIYLHIHYRNATTIGKDDMFSHAIHYNEGSYELWLMYINSRVQLDDRVAAYDTAISALCRRASSPEWDRVHASACILDLFLQLIDCLCMSISIVKAIHRIYGLLPSASDVENNSCMLISDILACLTVSDKCIFWICCVYVLIYRKLPDAVAQQFESKKKLQFMLEWPSVQVTVSEKNKALELMTMGVDSVSSKVGLYERDVHYLSASHVQCVAVLEGLECSKNLLEKYIKAYPTCLELVLISARLHSHCFGDLRFKGFEEALSDWPREIPGVQCIWNQYAQCALESGGFDFTKELMVRWFEYFSKIDGVQSGKLDVMEDDGLYHSPESLSPKFDVCFTFSNPTDELFGLLNLSLHRLLQNDHAKARLAIDRALKIAGPEDFMHCVREHAVFVSSDVLDQTADAPSSGVLGLLNFYMNDARVLPVSDLLSRKFCQDIKRPRIRQLVNNMLGPVSSDCSLVNSVLESWYGPSLFPENFGNTKDLVDLVETLMELFPANYPLALAVCKLISRKFTSSSVASASLSFWASSILVNSIYQSVPVAPEHKWVEAADILSNFVEAQDVSERFHQYALSVYPFSVKLWKSCYSFSKKGGNGSLVAQAARERGIKLV